MSQPDRVLRWLRDRGSRGIHSFEFFKPDPYGGLPMPRGADAIHRLKKAGVEIEAIDDPRGRSHGVTYVLKSVGGQASASSSDAESVRDPNPPSDEGPQPPAVHDEATPLFADGQSVKQSATSAYKVFEDAA